MKPLPANIGKRVLFEIAAKLGSQVFVVGTFNDWDPTANPLKDSQDSGLFKATVRVPMGTNEYKFVVNGAWVMDPKCLEWTTNACGSLNNVFSV